MKLPNGTAAQVIAKARTKKTASGWRLTKPEIPEPGSATGGWLWKSAGSAGSSWMTRVFIAAPLYW